MSGQLRKPGLVTLEVIGEKAPRQFRVASGPWFYAQQLCWIPEGQTNTVYSPIENIATWSKNDDY